MKNRATLIACLTLAAFIGLQARDSDRFSLDLYGGISWSSPDDLNSLSAYNRGYFAYLHSYYSGQDSPYSPVKMLDSQGEFQTLQRLWPLGGRIRYALSDTQRGLSVSLGLEYMQADLRSGASMRYSFDDFYQGAYEQQRTIGPQQIRLQAWTALLGVHYPVIELGRLRVELQLCAGPLRASCKTFCADVSAKTEASGYQYASESVHDISGKGTGLALEGGARLQFHLSGRLGLFLESGYSLQKVKRIHGSGHYRTQVKDNNQDGYRSVSDWEGDWVLRQGSYGAYPEVYWPGLETTAPFSLDLSAFHLRIGFSWRLF